MEATHSEFDPTLELVTGTERPEAARYVVRVTSGPARVWEDVCAPTAKVDADFEERSKSIREAELRALDSGSQTVIGRP